MATDIQSPGLVPPKPASPKPVPMAKPDPAGPKPLVELHNSIVAEDGRERLMHRQAPALVISGAIHAGIMGLFLIVAGSQGSTAPPPVENTLIETKVEDAPQKVENFDNTDIGNDPNKQTNYDNERIENVSVPGQVRMDQPIGIEGAPSGPPQTVPPPAGFGGGQGGGSDSAAPGAANTFGDAGGYMGGRTMAGMMFGGRSGATREKMLQDGGGNNASEASVASGLQWLVRQQKADGHWDFDGSQPDETGATGLALLPFLAAGQAHVPLKGEKESQYSQTVKRGLDYLVTRLPANGKFKTSNTGSHYIYGHCLSTIALCEAFGMTNDPKLKTPAQNALDYIRKAQHSAGGWRYTIGQPGDTSVTAWCLQALKSGYLAGLSVPRETMQKVNGYLDGVQYQNGAGYGYTDNSPRGPNLAAAGLLCRQYLGWGPKNPKLIAGVDLLRKSPPTKGRNEIYYYYYATQVIHFYGGDVWDREWNPKMRDLLIDTQDRTTSKDKGSWAPGQTLSDRSGGRLYVTCLSMLTLEVYYRHLPLYKRDGSGLNEMGI